MSVRAAEAYEQGEMPISRWTKTAIIQAVKGYQPFRLPILPEGGQSTPPAGLWKN